MTLQPADHETGWAGEPSGVAMAGKGQRRVPTRAAIGAGLFGLGAVLALAGVAGMVLDQDADPATAGNPPSEAVTAQTAAEAPKQTAPRTTPATEATVEAAAPSAPPTTPAPATASRPTSDPLRDADEIRSFLDRLGASMRADAVDDLTGWLHPLVLDRYGEEACRIYLAGVTDPDFALEVHRIDAPAPWTWQTDGDEVEVPTAVTIEVARQVDGQTVVQEMHLGAEQEQLRWFTDCGDPRP